MLHHPDTQSAPYLVLAFYHFAALADPDAEVRRHKEFLSTCDVTCRIYISEEGINAQMCLSREDAIRYMDWMKSREEFSSIHFKIQGATKQIFARVTVKKKPLVSFVKDISLEERGKHLPPSEWKKMLNEDPDKIVIDVRNEYEWEVGHFKGAEPVPCQTFREFQEYADGLKERLKSSPKKVMMYCTGGIRCEYFSALLKEKGIEEIYQLEGGVINYGEKEGASEWKGSLFVFDDRLTVPVGEGSQEVIGKCRHCGTPSDRFYNCANMDCNELFLSCDACLEKLSGCCQSACQDAPRLRPFEFAHTPFRRWYNYAKTKEELAQLNPRSQNAPQEEQCAQESKHHGHCDERGES